MASHEPDVDDLGMPIVGDPEAFGAAFNSIVRERQQRRSFDWATGPAVLDDLGFPVTGDAADFARAFVAVR